MAQTKSERLVSNAEAARRYRARRKLDRALSDVTDLPLPDREMGKAVGRRLMTMALTAPQARDAAFLGRAAYAYFGGKGGSDGLLGEHDEGEPAYVLHLRDQAARCDTYITIMSLAVKLGVTEEELHATDEGPLLRGARVVLAALAAKGADLDAVREMAVVALQEPAAALAGERARQQQEEAARVAEAAGVAPGVPPERAQNG